MKQLKYLIIVTLVVLAFLAAPLSRVPAAFAQTCAINHTVAAGETLSSIAFKYDVDWTEIATANNLKEPYTIYVGQVLCIPASATTTTTTGTTTTTTSSKPSFDAYVFEGRLYIEATNFPKRTAFFVKVGSGIYRVAEDEKIGILLTGPNTSVDASFRLEKDLRYARYLTVCIKNISSDVQLCSTIINPERR